MEASAEIPETTSYADNTPMADFECPKCHTAWIDDGRCPACGWTILRPRPPRLHKNFPFPVRKASGACWIGVPFVAGLANIFLPILCKATESAAIFATSMGIVAAELGLLAIVGALGPGGYFVRFAATFGVGVALLLSLFLGVAAAWEGAGLFNDLQELGGLFLVFPGLMLAAQSPLWLFRVVTGGRMRSEHESKFSAESSNTQFGISHLLMATTLIAVSLALARGTLALWNVPETDLADGWLAIGSFCGVFALASLSVTVPCTIAILVAREPAVGVVAIVFYVLVLSIVLLTMIEIVSGGAPGGEEFGLFSLFEFSTFAGVLLGLGAIRGCGYRVPPRSATAQARLP